MTNYKREIEEIRKMQKLRQQGTAPRDEYLFKTKSAKPWRQLGMSRSTYYSRKKAGLL